MLNTQTVREFPAHIKEIALRLAKQIPLPRRKPAKPQKSWAGLQVGQRLRVRGDQHIYTPSTGRCAGATVFQVTSADSEGALLELVSSEDGAIVGSQLRWTTKEWQGTFEKAGRSR